jgi:predicted transcriptional regulator
MSCRQMIFHRRIVRLGRIKLLENIDGTVVFEVTKVIEGFIDEVPNIAILGGPLRPRSQDRREERAKRRARTMIVLTRNVTFETTDRLREKSSAQLASL